MIKKYIGPIYKGGIRDEAHTVEVTEKDGYLCAECDVCGEALCDDYVGAAVSTEAKDLKDTAYYADWTVIGNHMICEECMGKISRGEIDIAILKVVNV